MTQSETLLAAMTFRFSSHPENIATEALLYLLSRHPSAWPGLRAYLTRTGIELPETLTFRSQAQHAGGSQPDLTGTNGLGQCCLIIESKFWAGLTQNQPVNYLESLPSDVPGMLLVLCPAKRLELLWDKLHSRVSNSSLPAGASSVLETGFLQCSVGLKHCMAILSWAQVLGVLDRVAQTANDATFLSDINQLRGLCDRMDSQAFLPLRAEHLGADFALRVQQFADLVDHVVESMVLAHGADKKGLSTGGTQSTYGRFFRLAGLGLFLQYAPTYWARFGETPLWLEIKKEVNKKWLAEPWITDRLDTLPPGRYRRIPKSEGGAFIVGLDVPLGFEKSEVIDALVDQVKEVVACVSSPGPGQRAASIG